MEYLALVNKYIMTYYDAVYEKICKLYMDYPLLGDFLSTLCLAAALSALIAYAGLNFISAVAKLICMIRSRTIYDKCARQIAMLTLLLGWILLIAGRLWLYFTQRNSLHEVPISDFVLEMSWLLLSIGVLLSSIYFIVWRTLKQMPVLHVTLGAISAIQNCIALLAVLTSLRMIAAYSTPGTNSSGLGGLLPDTWNAPAWSAAACMLPLVFSLGAAYAIIWLLVRRNRDDYGRDYYNVMIGWCSAWARNAWLVVYMIFLLSTGLHLLHRYQEKTFSPAVGINDGLLCLLWLCPAILWTIVRRSKIALRHKISLAIAFLISCAFTIPLYDGVSSF